MWGDADIEVDVAVEEVNGETVFSDTWAIERGNHWGNTSVATERGQYTARVEVGELVEEVDLVQAVYCFACSRQYPQSQDSDWGILMRSRSWSIHCFLT